MGLPRGVQRSLMAGRDKAPSFRVQGGAFCVAWRHARTTYPAAKRRTMGVADFRQYGFALSYVAGPAMPWCLTACGSLRSCPSSGGASHGRQVCM